MSPFVKRIAPTAAFLLAFFVLPLGILLAYSFGNSSLVSVEFGTSLENYAEILGTEVFRGVYFRTIWVGVLVGALSVALAFPLAYAITLGSMRRHGDTVLFLVLVSLFSAFIVRVYAWRSLLGRNGAINSGLQSLGVIDDPLDFLLYSKFALIVTLVNVLVPLAVLPLYSSLAGLDRQLIEASKSLGASPARTLWTVTTPMASRGILAAFILCFVIAAGDYVTPQLVGGPGGNLVGNLIVARFGIAFDWPLGSAMAFVLVTAMAATIATVVLLFRALHITDRPRQ